MEIVHTARPRLLSREKQISCPEPCREPVERLSKGPVGSYGLSVSNPCRTTCLEPVERVTPSPTPSRVLATFGPRCFLVVSAASARNVQIFGSVARGEADEASSRPTS